MAQPVAQWGLFGRLKDGGNVLEINSFETAYLVRCNKLICIMQEVTHFFSIIHKMKIVNCYLIVNTISECVGYLFSFCSPSGNASKYSTVCSRFNTAFSTRHHSRISCLPTVAKT